MQSSYHALGLYDEILVRSYQDEKHVRSYQNEDETFKLLL
jgi:hypothetical protein